jgi:hypothetical protein
MTKEQAIQLVEKHLAKHQTKDYRLKVVPSAITPDDDGWLIGVGPDRTGIRRYDYYDVLTQVEQEIEDENENAHISLMPPPSGSAE